ncbi:hypothetical protein PY650_05825 [Rhizobium calliandrae]|uniref:Uncharacterized protein n=1 Tax=Rhizobium calliandrae TaxID=1312182 RepID=A0ABT7K984_9HYPH|nr:hypothetical protein [Rhizobium calliandrae]
MLYRLAGGSTLKRDPIADGISQDGPTDAENWAAVWAAKVPDSANAVHWPGEAWPTDDPNTRATRGRALLWKIVHPIPQTPKLGSRYL